MPKITAISSNWSNRIATISGIARKTYLNKIEPSDNANAFFRVLPKRWGAVCAIMIKLKMLNTVPKTKPLPAGFKPATINSSAMTIAPAIALEQYFFCNCLIASIL